MFVWPRLRTYGVVLHRNIAAVGGFGASTSFLSYPVLRCVILTRNFPINAFAPLSAAMRLG